MRCVSVEGEVNRTQFLCYELNYQTERLFDRSLFLCRRLIHRMCVDFYLEKFRIRNILDCHFMCYLTRGHRQYLSNCYNASFKHV